MASVELNCQGSGALTERSHGQHPIPHVPHPVSTLSVSRCFFCVALAGVASHSILVATTGEPAPPRGFWANGVRQHPCPRLRPFSRAKSRQPSSLMVCLSFTSHSWPWTPSQSALSELTWSRFGPSPSNQRAHLPRTGTGEHGKARLVVLACETGGRWSEESHSFLRQLARARARSEPREMRAPARRARFRRWCTALACCAAQAFTFSLLERRGGLGSDEALPSTTDVIWEDRHGS